MARDLAGPMASAVASNAVAPLLFVELDFATAGYVRAWNGVGPVLWDSKTWLGTGELMSISEITETRAIERTTVSLSLSGVDSALVAVAYGDFSQGRPARVWLGAMDTQTGHIVADPYQIFAGRMDTINDADDGNTATITITAESSLADLKRIRARYMTNMDQQRIFPGDESFRFMPSLQEVPIFWGSRTGTPQVPQSSI